MLSSVEQSELLQQYRVEALYARRSRQSLVDFLYAPAPPLSSQQELSNHLIHAPPGDTPDEYRTKRNFAHNANEANAIALYGTTRTNSRGAEYGFISNASTTDWPSPPAERSHHPYQYPDASSARSSPPPRQLPPPTYLADAPPQPAAHAIPQSIAAHHAGRCNGSRPAESAASSTAHVAAAGQPASTRGVAQGGSTSPNVFEKSDHYDQLGTTSSWEHVCVRGSDTARQPTDTATVSAAAADVTLGARKRVGEGDGVLPSDSDDWARGEQRCCFVPIDPRDGRWRDDDRDEASRAGGRSDGEGGTARAAPSGSGMTRGGGDCVGKTSDDIRQTADCAPQDGALRLVVGVRMPSRVDIPTFVDEAVTPPALRGGIGSSYSDASAFSAVEGGGGDGGGGESALSQGAVARGDGMLSVEDAEGLRAGVGSDGDRERPRSDARSSPSVASEQGDNPAAVMEPVVVGVFSSSIVVDGGSPLCTPSAGGAVSDLFAPLDISTAASDAAAIDAGGVGDAAAADGTATATATAERPSDPNESSAPPLEATSNNAHSDGVLHTNNLSEGRHLAPSPPTSISRDSPSEKAIGDAADDAVVVGGAGRITGPPSDVAAGVRTRGDGDDADCNGARTSAVGAADGAPTSAVGADGARQLESQAHVNRWDQWYQPYERECSGGILAGGTGVTSATSATVVGSDDGDGTEDAAGTPNAVRDVVPPAEGAAVDDALGGGSLVVVDRANGRRQVVHAETASAASPSLGCGGDAEPTSGAVREDPIAVRDASAARGDGDGETAAVVVSTATISDHKVDSPVRRSAVPPPALSIGGISDRLRDFTSSEEEIRAAHHVLRHASAHQAHEPLYHLRSATSTPPPPPAVVAQSLHAPTPPVSVNPPATPPRGGSQRSHSSCTVQSAQLFVADDHGIVRASVDGNGRMVSVDGVDRDTRSANGDIDAAVVLAAAVAFPSKALASESAAVRAERSGDGRGTDSADVCGDRSVDAAAIGPAAAAVDSSQSRTGETSCPPAADDSSSRAACASASTTAAGVPPAGDSSSATRPATCPTLPTSPSPSADLVNTAPSRTVCKGTSSTATPASPLDRTTSGTRSPTRDEAVCSDERVITVSPVTVGRPRAVDASPGTEHAASAGGVSGSGGSDRAVDVVDGHHAERAAADSGRDAPAEQCAEDAAGAVAAVADVSETSVPSTKVQSDGAVPVGDGSHPSRPAVSVESTTESTPRAAAADVPAAAAGAGGAGAGVVAAEVASAPAEPPGSASGATDSSPTKATLSPARSRYSGGVLAGLNRWGLSSGATASPPSSPILSATPAPIPSVPSGAPTSPVATDSGATSTLAATGPTDTTEPVNEGVRACITSALSSMTSGSDARHDSTIASVESSRIVSSACSTPVTKAPAAGDESAGTFPTVRPSALSFSTQDELFEIPPEVWDTPDGEGNALFTVGPTPSAMEFREDLMVSPSYGDAVKGVVLRIVSHADSPPPPPPILLSEPKLRSRKPAAIAAWTAICRRPSVSRGRSAYYGSPTSASPRSMPRGGGFP